jgi:hypothetical protein
LTVKTDILPRRRSAPALLSLWERRAGGEGWPSA